MRCLFRYAGLGWTEQQVGDDLGITQQAVSKLLAPFRENMEEIEGIPPDKIFQYCRRMDGKVKKMF